MLKIENYEVVGWEHAIRGMRNPKNSWDRSDSGVVDCDNQECETCILKNEKRCSDYSNEMYIGPNDHTLMMSLAKGGPVHAKYRRMITVYLDITAPLYWWKEFDTYKVGTVANSCSTMHKIHDKFFELSDFSTEHMFKETLWDFKNYMGIMNQYLANYLETKDKRYWMQVIQMLPTSYNQKRTVMLNYEVLHNIYESRRHHKLDEWHTLCDWIEKLPYSEIITAKDPEYRPESAPVVHSPKTGRHGGYIRTQEDIERTRKLREQGLPEGVAAEDLTTITDYWPDKGEKDA